MGFVRIGKQEELPAGSVVEIVLDGQPYAICNAGGQFYALDGVCPHSGGPLGEGALHDFMLVCPWHAWEFDCRSGANDFDPDVKVATFPVKVEEGEILIDVTRADAGAA